MRKLSLEKAHAKLPIINQNEIKKNVYFNLLIEVKTRREESRIGSLMLLGGIVCIISNMDVDGAIDHDSVVKPTHIARDGLGGRLSLFPSVSIVV